MKTVVFDLDGTLADTAADLIGAANARFEALGLGQPLDPIVDAHTAFRGARAMLGLGFSRLGQGGEAEIDREYPLLLAYYAENLDHESRLYPGTEAALDRLAKAGYRLAVCTNKPEAMALDLLRSLGVLDRFAALIGADTLPTRKPDAAPYLAAVERAGGTVNRSLLVGDTETDRETARAAGVPCALVTFGPDGREVEALAPDALVEHFDELDAVVARLID